MSAPVTPRQTWADGYGLWHATVSAPHGASMSDVRRAGRAAIRAELLARAPRGARLVVRVGAPSFRMRDADPARMVWEITETAA